jgi:hypothetical protein
MITVEPGCSIAYVGELCLMTPYHYLVTLESESHFTHVLRIDMNAPDVLVREVKDPNTRGIFRSLNEVYPIGAKKPNSRYMGEIFRVGSLHDVVELQKSRDVRFFDQDQIRKLELPGNMAVVKPSPYTHNIVGYWERPEANIRVYALGLSSIRPDVQAAYEAAKEARRNWVWTPCCCPSTTWPPGSTARTGRRPSWNTSASAATTTGVPTTSPTRTPPPTSPRAFTSRTNWRARPRCSPRRTTPISSTTCCNCLPPPKPSCAITAPACTIWRWR